MARSEDAEAKPSGRRSPGLILHVVPQPDTAASSSPSWWRHATSLDARVDHSSRNAEPCSNI